MYCSFGSPFCLADGLFTQRFSLFVVSCINCLRRNINVLGFCDCYSKSESQYLSKILGIQLVLL